MQTSAPLYFFKKVTGADSGLLLPTTRQSEPSPDTQVREGPRDIHRSELMSWQRRAPVALMASFACFVVVALVGRFTAQQLVDASELTIERFALTRPVGDTAEASVAATLSMPRLRFGAALRGTQLILKYGESPVGTLTAGNWIALGYGGEVKLTLAGLISVTHYDAFKHLATQMLLHDNLTLGLRGGLTLGVPPIPLPVNAALVRDIALRGAAGLGLRITYFSFRDGLSDEFPGRPAPLPLMLEILVELHNPSSFDFSPLGQLELGIASESGLRFAMVRTDGVVDLPPGLSHLHLRGELAVADEDLMEFGPMMGDYIQGRAIPLQNVFLSSTEPLYHKALGGIPLKANLPGLNRGNWSRIFTRVMIIINPAVNVLELAQHGDLHDEALIEGSNPLNVSLSFYGIEVDIYFEGKWVGDVKLPSLAKPVTMYAFQQNFVPDVRFPVRIKAPTHTLLTMLERMMIPNGCIHVDMEIKLTFTAGNQNYTMPHSDYGVEVKLHI